MTQTAYEIPLLASPQAIVVTLGGVAYQMLVKWNDPMQRWVLNISNNSGVLLIGGIVLSTGVDLLDQFGYMNFGGKLYAQTDFNLLQEPNFYNLGTTGHLYFVVTT